MIINLKALFDLLNSSLKLVRLVHYKRIDSKNDLFSDLFDSVIHELNYFMSVYYFS